jgi:hypothetical protein
LVLPLLSFWWPGLSFSAGRWSAPTKTIERERIVKEQVKVRDELAISEAVSKAQAEWKQNEKVKTIEKTVYKEGQIVEKIVYVDRDSSSSGTNTISTTNVNAVHNVDVVIDRVEVEKEKIVTVEQPRWRVGASAALQWDKLSLTPADLTYEVRGEVRVIGGLWAGVTTTPQLKLVGVALSFQF